MIDLNQASYALRNTAGPRTLIILDEFGKGTLSTGVSTFFPFMNDHDSSTFSLAPVQTIRVDYGSYETTDGAGLFSGVIKHLLNRGEDCPIVFAATHFHEVLNEEMLSPTQLPISFVHMAVLLTTSDGDILKNGGSSISDSNNEDRKTGLRLSDGVTYLFKYVDERYERKYLLIT
jgi:DNA mismatch repair protein MSH5